MPFDFPMTDTPYSPEYLSLRAANDRLREEGKAWVWETLSSLCDEINRGGGAGPGQAVAQIGRQPWQFSVGRSLMIGERFGIRVRGKTMTTEIGWPREPEHGFVPDQGLARGRVSMSLSPMLEAKPSDDLILRPGASGEAVWYIIRKGTVDEVVTVSKLRTYLDALIEG